MNFFDAKLAKVDGKYAAVLGDYTVILPEDKQAALAANNVEEQEITLGVRPEHIGLSETEGVEAKIEVSEMMGSSVHLHVDSNGKDIVIVVSTMNMTGEEISAMRAGTMIRFAYSGSVCHVFNKETGINLEA